MHRYRAENMCLLLLLLILLNINKQFILSTGEKKLELKGEWGMSKSRDSKYRHLGEFWCKGEQEMGSSWRKKEDSKEGFCFRFKWVTEYLILFLSK